MRPSLLNIWWWYAYDLVYDWIHPEDAYIKQKSVGEFITKWLKIYSLTNVHLFVDKCEIILDTLLFESRNFETFLLNWKNIFQFICTIFLLLQLFYFACFIKWQVAALPPSCVKLSWNPGSSASCNAQGLSRSVMGLIYGKEKFSSLWPAHRERENLIVCFVSKLQLQDFTERRSNVNWKKSWAFFHWLLFGETLAACLSSLYNVDGFL